MKNLHILQFTDEYEKKLNLVTDYINKKLPEDEQIAPFDLLGIACYDKIDKLYHEYLNIDY